MKYGCYKFYMHLKTKIYYNVFIRYSLTSFLKIFIATGTTLTFVNFETGESLGQGILSIVLVSILVLLPFIYILVLYKSYSRLANPSKRE